MDNFKYTKNEFKREIRTLNILELKREMSDINLGLLKAKKVTSSGVNPNDKGKLPVKLLKWKRKILIMEMERKK